MCYSHSSIQGGKDKDDPQTAKLSPFCEFTPLISIWICLYEYRAVKIFLFFYFFKFSWKCRDVQNLPGVKKSLLNIKDWMCEAICHHGPGQVTVKIVYWKHEVIEITQYFPSHGSTSVVSNPDLYEHQLIICLLLCHKLEQNESFPRHSQDYLDCNNVIFQINSMK